MAYDKLHFKKENMETHLSIKHLSPYLPYELRIKNATTEMPLTGAYLDEINDPLFGFDNSYKPILLPISDLEKLIKSEFEKFDELGMTNYTSEIIDLFCYENTGFDENITEINLEKLPYECADYMFKNHYDFFGLIPKGLAIDKNTLL